MANGVLVSKTDSGDKTTWHWRETSPMVSYLSHRDQRLLRARARSTLANVLPRYDAVDPETRFYGGEDAPPRRTPGTTWPSSRRWSASSRTCTGPIPSRLSAGSWTRRRTCSSHSRPRRSRCMTCFLDRAHDRPRAGASVVRRRARARPLVRHVAERGLRHVERVDLDGAPQRPDRAAALQPAVRDSGGHRRAARTWWFPAPDALPGPADLFGTPVYDRGAMTLQALRAKIGNDTTFLNILRTWYAENRDLKRY